MTTATPQHRTLKGYVVSDKMQKTVVVEVTRMRIHPKYKKSYKVSTRFKAHSPENAFHIGDKVVIREGRPLSKEKRWTVISKI